MATYKVLQDIEAEDKLVGPLSLRQFIYAAIAAVATYISVISVTRGVAWVAIPFLPVIIVAGFFAFPWKGEQPTEIWAAARMRFMIKPRVRIWNQSGIKEIVTVTVPRNINDGRPKVHNLSETEVRSRLKALADTIDSRGWATRNVNYRYYTNAVNGQSDRAINASDLQPGSVPMDAFLPANDMLDDNNPRAQQIDNLLSQQAAAKREQAVKNIQAAQQAPTPPATAPIAPTPVAPIAQQQPAAPTVRPANSKLPELPAPIAIRVPATPAPTAPIAPAVEPPIASMAPSAPAPVKPPTVPAGAPPQWFANGDVPSDAPPINFGPTPAATPIAIPTSTPAGIALPPTPAQPVTAPSNPAILKLANNNDLNVATLAREANRSVHKDGGVEVQLR